MSARDACLLYARLPEHRYRVAQAERIVHEALERMHVPYVAYSAGKDSEVVNDIVRRAAPDTIAIYGDDEWKLPETEARIARMPNLRCIPMRVQHAEWFTAHEDLDAPAPTWAAELGYDGCFLGLRADENVRRRLLIRTRGATFYNERRRIWTCCPIAAWSVRDVWSYILSRGILYNAAYDVLDRLGIPLAQQRIGPFAVERVLGRGQLAILKRGWPELFNRFIARYPEARSYV
jgi:3'-phosphoadenosine 5'-phosphosulfate sulfotransferase (PAPS reductase)/FAD synthetase